MRVIPIDQEVPGKGNNKAAGRDSNLPAAWVAGKDRPAADKGRRVHFRSARQVATHHEQAVDRDRKARDNARQIDSKVHLKAGSSAPTRHVRRPMSPDARARDLALMSVKVFRMIARHKVIWVVRTARIIVPEHGKTARISDIIWWMNMVMVVITVVVIIITTTMTGSYLPLL